jgi:CBS domain-containing protein
MTEVRTVGELMAKQPITIQEDAPLKSAALVLEEHHIHGLPVVDAGGSLVGVLSQTDLVRARATEHLWSRWPGLSVKHLMSSPALTCRADTTIPEAVKLLEDNHVHRLIVVDDAGKKPVGVFSTSDVIRQLAGA